MTGSRPGRSTTRDSPGRWRPSSTSPGSASGSATSAPTSSADSPGGGARAISAWSHCEPTRVAVFARLLEGLAGVPGLRLWGVGDPARFDERVPTAAVTLEGNPGTDGVYDARRPRHRDVVGRLLCEGADRPPRSRAGGLAAHRADPLQHRGRGGSPRRRAQRDTRPAPAWRPRPVAEVAAVDVVIIGGGIVGVSAAAELAAAGARVRVYERATIAAGASGRNSRHLAAVRRGLRCPISRVAGALPRSRGARSWGWPCPPSRSASCRSAGTVPPSPLSRRSSRRPIRASSRRSSTRASCARSSRPWRRASRRTAQAIGYPLAPAAATWAYAALACARGGSSRGRRASVAIERARVAGIRLNGVVERADVVIVAAGPWTPSVIDPSGGWRPIRTSWGVVVELALSDPPRHVVEEAEVIEAAIEPGRSADDGGAVGFSMVTAAGISSLGSTFLPEEPDPQRSSRRCASAARSTCRRWRWRSLGGIRTCARPLSRDGHPLVGAVPGIDGLFVAAGHGPWGIPTGPASGAHVAGLALGDKGAVPEALRAAVDPARFGQPRSDLRGSAWVRAGQSAWVRAWVSGPAST